MSNIYLSFRFHTNFYHSYRGDTPDDFGFGMDIRIIRSILDDLDKLNREGIPVMGTWDIENYYSLEQYIPKYSPDIIDRIKKRVNANMDAVTPMSYNNGLVCAETKEEFSRNMEWTISNTEGSGLDDLFGKYEGVVRPQECMYTPSHLKYYKQHGINTISIYYSSHPFNGFSNFVAPLEFNQRYNPLTLKSKLTSDTMTLLPAYNHGDVADNWLSLRNWIKHLRKKQLKQKEQKDILLIVDMDADDPFWEGMKMPIVTKVFPSFDGLYRMVKSIASLDYVLYTTPQKYLENHEIEGSIYLEEDTADGSFDGLSSWAEKWENTDLWKKINAIRNKAEYIENLYEDKAMPDDIDLALQNCLKQRILAHSTTHFGLATPIMNVQRLKTAQDIINKADKYANNAFKLAMKDNKLSENTIYLGKNAGNILKRIQTNDNIYYFSDIDKMSNSQIESPKYLDKVRIENNTIYNNRVKISITDSNEIDIYMDGIKINKFSPSSSITYNNKRYYTRSFSHKTEIIGSDIGALTICGSIDIDNENAAKYTHRYILVKDTPYIYVEVKIDYPQTKHVGYDNALAKKLQSTWDARYEEVMPFEFCPNISGTASDELEVVKHNYFNDITSYKLDYYKYSKNRNLDSFNNHITNGFIGIKNDKHNLFITQCGCLDNNFAFCPMRLKMDKDDNQIIYLNPFGTYTGKQKKYPTKRTGIGKATSLLVADHLGSYAPSYNGKQTHFMLMISSSDNGQLTEETVNDMKAFSAVPITYSL